MTYNEDFYQNKPALTVNSFKEGHAYYIATRFEDDFYDEFYTQLLKETKIYRPLDIPLPEGVIVTDRDGYLFLQNFNHHEVTLSALPTTYQLIDSNRDIYHDFILQPFEVIIIHE